MDILADAVIKAASEAVDKEGGGNINLKTPEMISKSNGLRLFRLYDNSSQRSEHIQRAAAHGALGTAGCFHGRGAGTRATSPALFPAAFQVVNDLLRTGKELFHFLFMEALPDLFVNIPEVLMHLGGPAAAFLSEDYKEGTAAVGMLFPGQVSGLLQTVEGAGHGCHIHTAPVGQFPLGHMVFFI